MLHTHKAGWSPQVKVIKLSIDYCLKGRLLHKNTTQTTVEANKAKHRWLTAVCDLVGGVEVVVRRLGRAGWLKSTASLKKSNLSQVLLLEHAHVDLQTQHVLH